MCHYAVSAFVCCVYLLYVNILLRTRKAIKLCCLQGGRCGDHAFSVYDSSKIKYVGYEVLTAATMNITYYLLSYVGHSGSAIQGMNTGVVGSNSTQGMDVCVRLICVCVLCR
jgi:hypothetical protein